MNNNGTAEFQSLASNGATIPAGKAYLNAPSNGARLTIIFDETTGISSVNADGMDASVYKLNGQRMQNAKKGLNIINGRKVVIK